MEVKFSITDKKYIHMVQEYSQCNSGSANNINKKYLGGSIMERQIKHGKYYTCCRLRLLEYLLKKGFEPIKDIPDPHNWKYRHWIFENSVELEDALDEYFEELTKKGA